MTPSETWERYGRYALGAIACLVLGWFAFVKGHRVPLLSMADLGFHELGHMVFIPFPERLMFVMGSGMQVLVPLGLAAYFWFWTRNLVSSAFTLAWAGTSMQDVSVYIADAPYEYLPLLGNGDHDWAFLLNSYGKLHVADELASFVKYTGLLMLLIGLGLSIAGPFIETYTKRQTEGRRKRKQRIEIAKLERAKVRW